MKAFESRGSESRDMMTTEKSIRDYLASHRSGIGRLISGHFEIQTLEQAEKLSTMLASHYPSPERVSTGIWELISNAVEHGNLEIDFEQKTQLINRGEYAEEIVRRLSIPRFAERAVSVKFKRTKNRIRLRVTDQGSGFDFGKYLDKQISLDGPNGRGILIAAKFSFDKVAYRGRGNVVDAVVRL